MDTYTFRDREVVGTDSTALRLRAHRRQFKMQGVVDSKPSTGRRRGTPTYVIVAHRARAVEISPPDRAGFARSRETSQPGS